VTEGPSRSDPAGAAPRADRPETALRRGAAPLLMAVAAGAGLFLAWQAAGTLLLIFAGLLFGAFLDAATRALAYVLPVGRGWRLALVCALLAAATAMLLAWGGYNLVAQADGLIALIGDQLRALRGELRAIGIAPPPGSDGGQRTLLRLLLPDPSTLFGTAFSAFSLASGLLGNAIVVVFVGLFAAADPVTYRRGVLVLLPRHRRRRVGEVLDEMAAALRWWLVGQLVAVVLIALSTWLGLALIGMPGALLLGLQAGLVNFIPYLGPVIAAVPIGLAAMAQGTSMALWALGVHVLIQTVEGYVLAPLIQRRAVDLPPVLTLAAVALAGTLFGAMGVALATPLVAVLKVAAVRLYVEDRLGGG
jgi:predicted PurR-regulated permease PerM